MSRVVVLDTGPLGMISNPRPTPANLACQQWIVDRIDQAIRVILPEIVDYEVRRELLRANKTKGITRLDYYGVTLEYLPITTEAMRKAAELWAEARQKGYSTAGDKAIDADVILAAQVITLNLPNVVIATTNVGHLGRFIPAMLWSDIS